MPKKLSTTEIQLYHRDGYAFPVPVLTPQEVKALRQTMEVTVSAFQGPLEELYRHKLHLSFKWADDLVHHPAIVDAVEDILGPNILCWTSNLMVKSARDPAFVSWHQDSGYWGLEPSEVVTAWIALSPAPVEAGCMKVVPKTHLGPNMPHVDTFNKNNLLSRGQELTIEIKDDQGVAMPLLAGEMSLHHIKLVHGSGQNNSDDKRIGFAIRYMSDRVRKNGQRESAMLVRGENANDFFSLEKRPRQDFDIDGQLNHNRAVRRQIGNNYAPQGEANWAQKFRLSRKKLLSQAGLDFLYWKLKLQKLTSHERFY